MFRIYFKLSGYLKKAYTYFRISNGTSNKKRMRKQIGNSKSSNSEKTHKMLLAFTVAQPLYINLHNNGHFWITTYIYLFLISLDIVSNAKEFFYCIFYHFLSSHTFGFLFGTLSRGSIFRSTFLKRDKI